MLPNFEFENTTNNIEENFDVEFLGNDDVSGTFFFVDISFIYLYLPRKTSVKPSKIAKLERFFFFGRTSMWLFKLINHQATINLVPVGTPYSLCGQYVVGRIFSGLFTLFCSWNYIFFWKCASDFALGGLLPWPLASVEILTVWYFLQMMIKLSKVVFIVTKKNVTWKYLSQV